ncbi:hypothetical protein ACFLSJ_06600, partial [Verrucomicrobiota bacterium]
MTRRTIVTSLLSLLAMLWAADADEGTLRPHVLDDFESEETTRTTWDLSGVTSGRSREHATSGMHSLRVAVPPG